VSRLHGAKSLTRLAQATRSLSSGTPAVRHARSRIRSIEIDRDRDDRYALEIELTW